MSVLLKIVAVLFVAIGVFLIYAIIHAVGSAGGANVPVCIGYAIAAGLLGFFASKLWRRSPSVPASAAGS